MMHHCLTAAISRAPIKNASRQIQPTLRVNNTPRQFQVQDSQQVSLLLLKRWYADPKAKDAKPAAADKKEDAPKDVKTTAKDTSATTATKSKSTADSTPQPSTPQKATFKLEPLDYKLKAGVIVERIPVVLPAMEPWQKEYYDWRVEYETAEAIQQDEAANLRAETELKLRAKKSKAQKKRDEKSAIKSGAKDASGKPTSNTREEEEESSRPEDKEEAEYSLTTPEDQANNRKSLYRKLTNRLFLIVKKPRAQHAWGFPQGGYEDIDGNHLRKTAQREALEECGKQLSLWWIGHCPIAHYAYKSEGKDAKAFFYKAQYIAGTPSLKQDELEDYLWVTKEELKEYIAPDLYEAVKDALLD